MVKSSTKLAVTTLCFVIGAALNGCASPGTALSAAGGGDAAAEQGVPSASVTAVQAPAPDTDTPIVTYHGGSIRLELPPAGVTPQMSADDAYQRFQGGNLFLDAPKYSEPIVRYALLTNLSNGTLRDDGSVDPAHVAEPVWVVAFTGYPVHAAGGASAEGASVSEPPAVLQDIVSIFSDKTGSSLSVLVDVPDDPYQEVPVGQDSSMADSAKFPPPHK